MALLTTAALTIGPRRRPSTTTWSEAVGGSSVANHQVRRPCVSGAGTSTRSPTASGPTATTTALPATRRPSAHSTDGCDPSVRRDDPGEERLEHLVAQRATHAGPVEPLPEAAVGARDDAPRGDEGGSG